MKPDTKLELIKGVGPKTTEQLHAAGLQTVDDLVRFFPFRYDDYSVVTTVSAIKPGKVSLRGRFKDVSSRRVRRGMSLTQATFVDSTGKVAAIWFNQSYRAAQLKPGVEYLVSGEFAFQRGRYQLQNPSVELASGDELSGGRLVPVYRQVKGLKTTTLRKILFELRPYMLSQGETLPETLLKREKLMAYADAVHALHFPRDTDELMVAKDRMGFEELLALMLAAQMNRADNESLQAHKIGFSAKDAQSFVAKLPFELTNSQRIAAWEAIQNLGSGVPMNRLLQGDVGSGKTVVAGLVAHIAARRGFQTAFLAPTELLAKQHADTLQSLLDGSEAKVGLLTGSVKGKARQNLLNSLAAGEIDVIVGTHALLQDKVMFHSLGFVVIDEQHRFGVDQRNKLLAKSNLVDNDASHRLQGEGDLLEFTSKSRAERQAPLRYMPHLLAMTATPIPRSLQLTVYGELDVSILREKPKNRLPIKTEIVSPNSRTQMYEKVEKEIEAGHQVYVICPLITGFPLPSYAPPLATLRRSLDAGPVSESAPTSEKSEILSEVGAAPLAATRLGDGSTGERKSVETEVKRLRQGPFKHRRIGMLHGKLKSDEKQAVMTDFAAGKLDILVSTTVVEVGVDVSSATVIIIEGADTFGLAQLHQLRGRVGRSELQSYCYLVPSTSQKPSRRLRELERSNDGFYLAEKDLELRGPGEIYGRMQHGALNLEFARVGDLAQLKKTKAAVEWLLDQRDLDLIQYRKLWGQVQAYRHLTTLN